MIENDKNIKKKQNKLKLKTRMAKEYVSNENDNEGE